MPRRKQNQFLSRLNHFFTPQRSNNHRPQILHPDSLLVIIFVAVGFFALIQTVRFFPSLKNSVLGFSSSITVEQVVSQTNKERAKQGLSALNLNQQLSAAALAKAQDMLEQQYWAHTSPEGKKPWDFMKQASYRYRVAGENLARDFHGTNEMMKAWMASPTHKANIVNGQYQQIGVAVVDGRLEGFDTTLVVQMFGTPSTQTAQIGEQATSNQDEGIAFKVAEQVNAPAGNQQPMQNPIRAVEEETDDDRSIPDDEQAAQELVAVSPNQQTVQTDSGVLGSAIEPLANLGKSAIFTPLQLTKIFFLGVIMMIVITLSYDSFIIGHRKSMRLVGENLGHIILFFCVAFLVILFKGGMIK